jgi:hypothetical protein
VQKIRPLTVVHACNSSYSRGRQQEDCGLKSARHESPSQSIKLGAMVHACHPATGSVNRQICSPGQPGHKCETLFEKYLKQKGPGMWLKALSSTPVLLNIYIYKHM